MGIRDRDGELDKVDGLTMGADDYITKPFRPLEMTARVKAQLRRAREYNQPALPPEGEVIRLRGLELDRLSHRCSFEGKILSLTPTEFSILWELCRGEGQVIAAEELFRRVWKEKYFGNSANTVSVHMRHLREKLAAAGCQGLIKTIWGVGYQIEG